MDETSQKIIDATMSLIRDKGYMATTTKDIASTAQVNECTIFRKFKRKKDIVLEGMSEERWHPNISPELVENVTWELKSDLVFFIETYFERVTPDFVKLSIGLRAPQIYEEIAPLIMKTPQVFIVSLQDYFRRMYELGKIDNNDFECLAMTILSATFGFTFLKASFGDNLSSITQKEYLERSVELFIKGLQNE